jgi:molybdate/tungstate transport system substrate-binding protein
MRRVGWLLAIVGALAPTACQRGGATKPLEVFAAASLSRVLGELEPVLQKERPDLRLALEPSGSQIAARKVSELRRTADLVISADWRVIENLLLPEHAGFNLRFATNELVLAHGEHSLGTESIDAGNWPALILEPGVRLARVDESTGPVGYQTLLVLRLAELHYPPELAGALQKRFLERVPKERVLPDVEEAAMLLESRAVDYVFIYRSVAEEHRLKFVPLPEEINLGSAARAEVYARAEVEVRLREGAPPKRFRGEPIVYSLAIPKNARDPEGAIALVRTLLGPEGRRLMTQTGFKPLVPPLCATPEALPPALRPLLHSAR